MSIADILTLSRLLITPFFVAAFINGRGGMALLLFSVAGFTDLVDGTIARFFREQTKFGALLDPIADKLLLQSCFVCLAVSGVLPLWFLSLAFLRDLMILSGIFYLHRIQAKVTYSAVWASKFATLLQLTTAVVALVFWSGLLHAPTADGLRTWLSSLIIVSTVLILVSGGQYVLLGIRILRGRAHA